MKVCRYIKHGGFMAITDKVKALLKLQGKNNKGLAEYLGISVQALSNKFYRDSYSGEDLIKIADFLDCEIAFIAGDTKLPLTSGDIKGNVKETPKKKTKNKK
jgi:transcriptional regulator with XRE-family HTH domain